MGGNDSKKRSEPSYPVRLGISWATNAIILGILAAVLPNVHVSNARSLLLAAAVFGVLNTILKPLLRLITLPLAIITLGIAWFFVSLFMILLTEVIVPGFTVHGFTTLIEATFIVWIVNIVLDLLPGPWQLAGKRRKS